MKIRTLLLSLTTLLLSFATMAQEMGNFRAARIVSPEFSDEGITFRLRADYATQVNLSVAWQSGLVAMEMPQTSGWERASV